METLSHKLQPYKEQIGQTASIVTIVQFFSGSLICINIYKSKSTKDISALPFIGGIVIGILVLKYAMLLDDKNMYHVNVAAILLNIFYLIFYALFSKDLVKEIINPTLKGSLLIGLLYTYIKYENPTNLEYRYGMIVTIMMLLLLGSPLAETKEIIRKKDASSIPFPLTFMGFIVSFLWLLYGIALNNAFMIVQNLLGLILCFMQLILCSKYPGKKRKERVD